MLLLVLVCKQVRACTSSFKIGTITKMNKRVDQGGAHLLYCTVCGMYVKWLCVFLCSLPH